MLESADSISFQQSQIPNPEGYKQLEIKTFNNDNLQRENKIPPLVDVPWMSPTSQRSSANGKQVNFKDQQTPSIKKKRLFDAN